MIVNRLTNARIADSEVCMGKATAMSHSVLNTLLTLEMLYLVTAENSTGLQANYDGHCVCLGDTVLFECTVPGGGSTVWRGEAFNCSETNNKIQLLHGENETLQCNNGEISAHPIHSQPHGNLYTSQLTVRVGPDTNGTTIECIHDDGANLNDVGLAVLNITTEAPPPPNDIYLVNMSSDQLVFEWSEVTSNCSVFHYRINSSNCGQCPNVTTNTTATCRENFNTISLRLCLFTVQSVVCDSGDINGDTKNISIEVGRNMTEEEHGSNNATESGDTISESINSLDLEFIIIATLVSILVTLGIAFTLGTALVCIVLTRKASHTKTDNTTTSPKPETNSEQNHNQDEALQCHVYSVLEQPADFEMEENNRRIEATNVIYAEVDDLTTSANIQTLKPLTDNSVQYSEIQRETEMVCDQQHHHGLTYEPGGDTTIYDDTVNPGNTDDDEHTAPELPPRCY